MKQLEHLERFYQFRVKNYETYYDPGLMSSVMYGQTLNSAINEEYRVNTKYQFTIVADERFVIMLDYLLESFGKMYIDKENLTISWLERRDLDSKLQLYDTDVILSAIEKGEKERKLENELENMFPKYREEKEHLRKMYLAEYYLRS